MDKHYKVLYIKDLGKNEYILEDMTKEGYILVSVDNGLHYFFRANLNKTNRRGSE